MMIYSVEKGKMHFVGGGIEGSRHWLITGSFSQPRIIKGRKKHKEESAISFCDKSGWEIGLFPFGQFFPNYSCCKNLWVVPSNASVYP